MVANYDARIIIANTLIINPRKAELRDGALLLRFRPGTEDAHTMEAWFVTTRTPNEDYERELLVEFGKRRRRVRLLGAYPIARHTLRDQIGRERIEFVVHYGELEKVP